MPGDPRPGSGHRARALALLGIVAASAALALARFDSFPVGGFYDDAHYVVLAEALAHGRGMRLVSFPEAPAEWAFPAGFPLMLAPLSAMWPGRYGVLKLVSLACWLGAIPLVYRLARQQVRPAALPGTADGPADAVLPWLATLLVAFNPSAVAASAMVMSEVPYLFFSLLALVLFEGWSARRGRDVEADPGLHPGRLLGAAAAAVWAQLVRSVGAALFVAMVAAPLVRRRWRDAALAAGALALCLLPQIAWSLAAGAGPLSAEYRSRLFSGSPAETLAHVAANGRAYVEILPHLLVPLFGPRLVPALAGSGLGWVPPAFHVLLLAAVATGLALRLRRPGAPEIYALVYLVPVLAFWNPEVENAQERYLLPLLPFLYLWLLEAGRWLLGSLRGRRGRPGLDPARAGRARAALVALAVPLLLLLVLRNVQDALHPVREAMTDLSAGASWIASHTSVDAVVMSKNPVQDYLYARRLTVPYPARAGELDAVVAARGVDYVLIAPRLARTREKNLEPWVAAELLPALRARPGRYAEVFRDPAANATVFAVR